MGMILLWSGSSPGVAPPVLDATLTVTPRLSGVLALQPLLSSTGSFGAPYCVPGAIHRVTISGVQTITGTLLTSALAACNVQVLDGITGVQYYAQAAMAYDSSGQWHADVPASAFPTGRPVIVYVYIYDFFTTALLRTVGQTLVPLGPTILKAAAYSANRVQVTAVTDLGTPQDNTNTACTLTVVDGTQTVILNAVSMTYLASNEWYYDAASGVFPLGAVLGITVAIYDQTVTTRRGSVYGWALAS